MPFRSSMLVPAVLVPEEASGSYRSLCLSLQVLSCASSGPLVHSRRSFGGPGLLADPHAGRVHRLQYSLSSLLVASHDGRPGTACAAESPSSRSKPRRQLGHAGIHPSAAFARALLAPGILVP